MPIRYTSADWLDQGIPLGGLGCGALQIFPDGTRGEFTGLNNWDKPLGQLHGFRHGSGSDFRVSNPFGIFVSAGKKRFAKLLQTRPIAGLPTVSNIRFEADFPVAELFFEDPELPIRLSVCIFSAFIPEAYKESGLPAVIYRWKLSNPQSVPVTVGLLACAVNPVGSWNVSRYNTVIRQNGSLGITFRRKHASVNDDRQGTVSLMTRRGKEEVTYWGSWMYAKEPFQAEQEDRRLQAWEFFALDGRLPNDAKIREAFGELDEPMGAIAIRSEIPAGACVEWPMVYSWHMPNHPFGHAYANHFPNAWSVGEFLLKKQDSLLRRIRAWQETIRQGPWPSWLSDALINTLCVCSAASVWTRKGEFAVFENPVKWPLMDSLDVRYYGSLPLAMFFPKLEHETLDLFRRHQRPDGRIPHDLGRFQLNCPSDGTTAGAGWKDLSTKYALMVYRNFLWTKKPLWIRRFYPSVKRAMQWQLAADQDGDGLPENQGRDSTYDLWDFYGASSYTACIHLAALKATESLARIAGDKRFALQCHAAFSCGAKSFDELLWTGSYYRAAHSSNGVLYQACIAGQLNGQWYAHLLGLGYLFEASRVRRAVETMLKLNGAASSYGAVNSVFPDGRVDEQSWHSANVWVGETYALAALAIYEGFVEEGMALAQKTWLNFVGKAKRPWSQPDVVRATDGSLGDGELYLRSLTIWALPLALASFDSRARRVIKALAPALSLPALHRRAAEAAVGTS